jgi:DNA-binding transcriptional ArsR family regulator
VKIATQLSKLIKEEEEERGFHIFANKHRREIFKELTRAPCQTSSSIARALGYDVQTVEWHLKKLIAEGFVDLKEYKKKLFCPVNLILEEDVPLFSLLNTQSGWLIVNSLLNKCRDVPFLCKHTSRATTYRIIKELRDLGFLEEIKGTKRLVCLNDRFYNKIEEYSSIGLEFKKKFIEKIDKKGYSVEIIGSYNYEVTIRITGIENFTLGIYISPIKSILEGRR